MKDWYTIDDIDSLDSPQLVVYPDRIRQNIASAIAMTGGTERLRPHVKTNKTAEVMRMMLDAGIRKFKCATIAESELLAMLHAPDVLLAYQPVGPKVHRLLQLSARYPDTGFSCLTDHPAAAESIGEVFSAAGKQMDVFIDLNVGMDRTGIAPEQALALYRLLSRIKGIRLRGLHAYDGHCRNTDIAKRKIDCDAGFEKVLHLKKKIMDAGYPEPTIIAGGSPTFPIHARREDVECSPGTFVLWDKGYTDICPEQPFRPAALVVSRVISLPAKGKICIDIGHKSIAAENEIGRRAFFLNAPGLALVSQSEEHGIVAAQNDHTYAPGDVFYVMPYHVCPTVALYDHMVTIENHRATGVWKVTARDREIHC